MKKTTKIAIGAFFTYMLVEESDLVAKILEIFIEEKRKILKSTETKSID